MAQQSAEVLYRLLCLVRIEGNQGIDVVQGVQQKMRIDLVVQVFQFGFNPFQFGLLPAIFYSYGWWRPVLQSVRTE